MTRLGRFLPKQWHFRLALPKAISMDLGSSFTRVKIDHKIVFHDRTCIVFDEKTQEVVAIGQAAEVFQGRVPAGMKLVRPIRQGKVNDIMAAQLFLKAVLQKVNQPYGNLPLPFISQPLSVAVSANTSQVQKELFRHFFRDLHAHAFFTPKATALFASVLTPAMKSGVWCCLDIGGSTSEVAIWSNGQVLVQQTLAVGGDHFTKQVLSVTKKKYQAEIGWLTAEQIKKNILCLTGKLATVVTTSEEESGTLVKSRRLKNKEMVADTDTNIGPGKLTIRARSSVTDLPTTLVISAEPYMKPLEEVAQELVWLLKEAIQDLSPELLSSFLENGLLLTGGGSLLPGLANYIEQQLQATVIPSAHPREDIIRGL